VISNTRPLTRAKLVLGLSAVLSDPSFPPTSQRNIARQEGSCDKGDFKKVFASRTQMLESLVEFAEHARDSITRQVTERTPPGPLRQGRIAAGLCQFFTKNPSCASLLLASTIRSEKPRFYERVARYWASLPALVGDVHADLVAGRVAIYVSSGFKRRPDERLDDVLTQLEEPQLW
jgi:hypothetical protein